MKKKTITYQVKPEEVSFFSFLDSLVDDFKKYKIKGDRLNCYYLSPKYGPMKFVIHLGDVNYQSSKK